MEELLPALLSPRLPILPLPCTNGAQVLLCINVVQVLLYIECINVVQVLPCMNGAHGFAVHDRSPGMLGSREEKPGGGPKYLDQRLVSRVEFDF